MSGILNLVPVAESWKQALSKIVENAKRDFRDGYPHYTDPDTGNWITLPAKQIGAMREGRWTHGNWTAGFWPGILWLAYIYTQEDKFKQWALSALGPLEGRARDINTHDLGFFFYPSFVLGFKLTASEKLRETALTAAETVASRFNPNGKYIQAFGPRGDDHWRQTSTIDTMMNLPLLWWAYNETGNDHYWSVAVSHAESTLRNLVREDSSTVHLVLYDPQSGRLKEQTTFQGYSNRSCWARGQSWGIYGFSLAYEHSKQKVFRQAACDLADYFIRRLPEDHVPYWDFDDPAIPEAPKDSSAAAIAACGLLKLAELVDENATKYRKSAERIMASLSANYVDHENRTQGIVTRACYSKPHAEGVDSCLIFGDYFYLSALTQLNSL